MPTPIYQLEAYKALLDAIDNLTFSSAIHPVGLMHISELTTDKVKEIEDYITDQLTRLRILTEDNIDHLYAFIDVLADRVVTTDCIMEDAGDVVADARETPNGAEDNGTITAEPAKEDDSDGDDGDDANLTPSDDSSDYMTAPEE